MLDVQSVTVRFGGVVALKEISAQFLSPISGIIGPNGAGKTTLMNVMSGFATPATGAVVKDSQTLTKMAPHKRAHWGLRRSFQKEEIANDLTVVDNILVQTDHGIRGGRKRDEVMHLLEVVGLADKAAHFGRELNTFERRLTDVAKCMAGRPKLIMFDEPAGGLSVEETTRLGDLILSIPKETGAQTLVIDHDVDLISRVCAQTLVLDFGQRIAFGPTKDVLADPKVKAAYLGSEDVTQEA